MKFPAVAILSFLTSAGFLLAEDNGGPTTGSLVQSFVAAPAPKIYKPRDPCREIDSVVWTLNGIDPKDGWIEFSGKVWRVATNGIYIRTTSLPGEPIDYFVANFPYVVADNESIGRDDQTLQFLCAKIAGTYTYTPPSGVPRTLRKLDYGKIYIPPPPSPEQLAAADKKKKAAAEHALELNQASADKGEVYGLLRMGERYRDGDGVEKDEDKARDYLKRALDAGSSTAADDLKKLAAADQMADGAKQ